VRGKGEINKDNTKNIHRGGNGGRTFGSTKMVKGGEIRRR
jgi:hypothetical protein